jgi:hypothetical protein
VLHAPNPFDVVRRVETEPTSRAGGLEKAVPPLPRAKELRLDAGASTELTNPEEAGFHGLTIQHLDNFLTNRSSDANVGRDSFYTGGLQQ